MVGLDKPKTINHKQFKDIRQGKQNKRKETFDRGTRTLKQLHLGQAVRFQVEPSGRWKRGTLKRPDGNISCVVETESGTYQRNR